MTQSFDIGFRKIGLALLGAGSMMALVAPQASAQAPFTAVDSTATGSISFSATSGGGIEAGQEAQVNGRGFAAGQRVEILYGDIALTSAPLVADVEGNVSGRIAIPANAVPGIYPVGVLVREPYRLSIAELKVSPTIPVFGEEGFDIRKASVVRGQYQSAYNAADNTLFVTSAVGRPPVRESEILKLDGTSLEVLARVSPAPVPGTAPADGASGVYAVYGIALDNSKGTLWVTNTRQNTVAVYKQDDLSLVKQFPVGTVGHARDVRVHEGLGRAFASAGTSPNIEVFDTGTLEKVATISIQSGIRGQNFSAMSLSLDRAANRLYVAGLSTGEVAVVDLQTNQVLNVFRIPGAQGLIGVSHDPATGRIYASAQGSDSLYILDGASGELLFHTPVGAGSHNVAVDAAGRRVYVEGRVAGWLTVTDMDGKIVANLGQMPRLNHVEIGGNGVIYAVDKSSGATDGDLDVIYRISPK